MDLHLYVWCHVKNILAKPEDRWKEEYITNGTVTLKTIQKRINYVNLVLRWLSEIFRSIHIFISRAIELSKRSYTPQVCFALKKGYIGSLLSTERLWVGAKPTRNLMLTKSVLNLWHFGGYCLVL